MPGPQGSTKFANARPPGLTRQLDKYSAVARGGGGGGGGGGAQLELRDALKGKTTETIAGCISASVLFSFLKCRIKTDVGRLVKTFASLPPKQNVHVSKA